MPENNKPKHTSGPWEIHGFDPETDKVIVLSPNANPGMCGVCLIQYATDEDLSLIAAAPDLAEALRELTMACDTRGPIAPDSPLGKGRAALKKAGVR